MDTIVDLINRNSYLVITTFAISFLANFIQISTYFRDRRRIKEEKEESERLFGELQKYKYVVGLAERSVKTEEELKEVEEDILQRKSAAEEIDKRMQQMQLVAQHRIVQNVIERSLTDLISAYEDVRALRTQYQSLGPLPDIPDAARAEIEREVTVAVRKPYELPRAFSFRALLLVLFIFFLPWPIDSVITLLFLHAFLALFFEAAGMYSDRSVSAWVKSHAQGIGAFSAISAWYVLLKVLQSSVVAPLQSIFISRYIWAVSELVIVLFSILVGLLHWRAIRARVLPRLPSSVDAAPAIMV